MSSDEKQWSSVREAFVYWANKRKANSVRSYASVREAILALANNESKSNGGGGGGDLGGLFTIIYTTDAEEQQVIDYVIGNEEFLWSKDLKILTEEAAELFNSRRYTEDPYVLQDGDIINITDLLRHFVLEDVTPEQQESNNEPIASILRIKTQGVEGFYSNGFVSARGADNGASSGGSGIDEEELWDILGAVGQNEQINLAHLTDLQTWVSNNFYQRNGQDRLLTESDLLSNYTIWGQRFHADSGDLTKKIITGNMSNVGNITMDGSIYMGLNHDVIISVVTNYLNSNVGFYSNSFVSARGVDSTASSGSSDFDEDDMWTLLATDDSTHKIHNSHLDGIVTETALNSILANYLTIASLQTELNNYTIWGAHFINKVISGNMSNVGNISMIGDINYINTAYFGSGNSRYITYYGNNIKSNVGFYSDSFVSARGVDSTPISGDTLDEDDLWSILSTNDPTHKIHNSHLDDFVTNTSLDNILRNYLTVTSLQAELNNYTIWGAHFVNKVISGNMSNVGNISMNGNIDYVTNLYFNSTKSVYLVADNTALKSNSGFYSLGYISARGLDPSAASSGNDFDEDAMWDELGRNDSTKLINSSHITGFITESQLNQAIINMVTTTTLPTILQTYTVWGQHLTSVTNGNMTGVGNITMSGNISMTSNSGIISGLSSLRFGSDTSKSLSLVSSYINSSVGFYSNSFVSARGIDSNVLIDPFEESDMWDLLANTSSGHLINANLIPINNGLSISSGRIIVDNTVVRTQHVGGLTLWLGPTSQLPQPAQRDANTIYFETSNS